MMAGVGEVCYTRAKVCRAGGLNAALHGSRRDAVVQTAWTPETIWQLFESTGSIWVYLIYRRFAAFQKSRLKVSPN